MIQDRVGFQNLYEYLKHIGFPVKNDSLKFNSSKPKWLKLALNLPEPEGCTGFEAVRIREAEQGSSKQACRCREVKAGRCRCSRSMNTSVIRRSAVHSPSPLLLSLLAAYAAGRHDRSPRPWRQRRQILAGADQDISNRWRSYELWGLSKL